MIAKTGSFPSARTQTHPIREFSRAIGAAAGRFRLLSIGLALVVVISVTAVVQLRLNAWNEPFYESLERKEVGAFIHQLAIFGVIAASLLFLNVAQTWLDQILKLDLRVALTRDLLDQWLTPGRAFLLASRSEMGINPDQRIHEDTRRLSELSAALAIGLFQSTLLLGAFVGVLWALSRGFVFSYGGASYAIPGFMLWCALTYAASGSWLSWIVGRPLMKVGLLRAAQEADFRFALVRVSESADGIALSAGERDERRHLEEELGRIAATMRQSARNIARLTWVTAGYGWGALIAPIVIAAPGYFGGQLSFGELMMTVGAFNQVQQSLRWFVDNASGVAEWRAALIRVMSFRNTASTIDQVEASTGKLNVYPAGSLRFDHLAVRVGDRDLTLDDPVVELGPGDRVLMIGKPGIGKSVFFRAVAGLWPWGRGTLGLPPRNTTMFLPQHAYLPTGTLRHALTYPLDQKQFLDSDLIEALDRTGLAHLVPLLDDKVRWEKTLSNNEQLHLLLAQLLVHRPQWVISDEGLSHLNEEDRALVFSLFQNELERSALLTITSDDAQRGFYTWVVHLVSRPIARGDKEPLSGNTVPSSTR